MLPEVRWIQRLDSFERAFAVLQRIAAIKNEMENLLKTMKKQAEERNVVRAS